MCIHRHIWVAAFLAPIVCLAGVVLCFLWVMGDVHTTLDDADYTQATAEWGNGLDLPADATHISVWEEVGGFQHLDRYYCFTVNPARIVAVVDEVASLSQKRSKRSITFTKCDVSTVHGNWGGTAEAKPVGWTPDTITMGIYQGSLESYAPRMWADKISGKVYVNVAD